jgi:hypothetical protein
MLDLTPAFTTSRMRVFEMRLEPGPETGLRLVYLAFRLSDGAPGALANAVILDQRGQLSARPPLYCDWLEVCSAFRLQGYAKELFLALEGHLDGRLEAQAASPDGAALLVALGRDPGPLGRSISKEAARPPSLSSSVRWGLARKRAMS